MKYLTQQMAIHREWLWLCVGLIAMISGIVTEAQSSPRDKVNSENIETATFALG